MKYNYIKYIALLFVVALFASCSDSLLEKEVVGDLSTEDNAGGEAEATASIFGVYASLQNSYLGGDWNTPWLIYTLLGDDLSAGGGSSADQPKYQDIDRFQHGVSNAAITESYKGYYKIITSSNNIINSGVEFPQVLGEAKFFRAFAYFNLVRAWGGVPLYLDNSVDPNDLVRATKADVYAAIEKDLTEAAGHLPLKGDLADTEKFRISKGTAQTLLGKAYLYQEKYAKAHGVLAQVISSTQYDLEDNFKEIWDNDKLAGKESILDVMFTSSEKYGWGTARWDGTGESNLIVTLCGPRGGAFDFKTYNATVQEKMNGEEAEKYSTKIDDIMNGWGFNMPTEKIGKMIIEAGGANRIDGTILTEADFVADGGVVDKSSVDFNWDSYEKFIRLKYVTRESHTTTEGGAEPIINFQTPFKLLRYADVLLMAAEAYNKDGQDGKAKIELEKIADRAGVADYSAFEGKSGNDLFEYIVKERAVELAFEGERFFDLVRWGKASTELGPLGFQSGKHELLPIPKAELDLSTVLDPEEDQNPGY